MVEGAKFQHSKGPKGEIVKEKKTDKMTREQRGGAEFAGKGGGVQRTRCKVLRGKLMGNPL